MRGEEHRDSGTRGSAPQHARHGLTTSEARGARVLCKIPGDPPEKGGGNGSSAMIAGAFGGGVPRPHTRDEALDGRAKPASKATRPVRIEELRCDARAGNGPIRHSSRRIVEGMRERSGHKTQAQRNRTGRKGPGSTESVLRFRSNAAGTRNGAQRHGGSGGMIPAIDWSGRTPLRALAEKPASAARCINLQD